MQKFLFISVGLFLGLQVSAQSYRLLSGDREVDSLQQKTIYFSFDDLSFFKDNEYFNLIADGYTLLGNKLEINIKYKPQDAYCIKLGVTAVKYHGMSSFHRISPDISLEIYNGNHTFIFGDLRSDDNHRFFNQFYAFERLLNERNQETGLEHRYINENWFVDTWLDWEKFIFKSDDRRERLNFGNSTNFSLKLTDAIYLKFPFQLFLQHRGGQINLRSHSLDGLNTSMVILNAGFGSKMFYVFNKHHKMYVSYARLLSAINTENTEELIFKKGSANLFSLGCVFDHWNMDVSYWHGRKFISPKGDDMFQSVSRRVDRYFFDDGTQGDVYSSHAEPDRTLIFGSVSYQNKLFKGLSIGGELDVYYQDYRSEINHFLHEVVVSNQIDYSIGIFLKYRFNTPLYRIKS